MNMKDKIKTFVVGAVTTLLTSCGFKSNNAPKEDAGELIRNSTEWTVNPTELASGTFETMDPFESRSLAAFIKHEVAEFVPQGEKHLVGRFVEISSKGASSALHNFITNQGTPLEKDGKVLFSLEIQNGKAVNPVYVDCPTAERTTVSNNEEHYGNATVKRKNPKIEKSMVLAVDTNTIGIAKEEVSTLVKEYYKVKKMVTGEAERNLQVGDTIEVFKNVRYEKNHKVNPNDLPGFGARQGEAGSGPDHAVPGAMVVKEQAIVQKAGVSPTYKTMDDRKEQTNIKLIFNYARNNLNVKE